MGLSKRYSEESEEGLQILFRSLLCMKAYRVKRGVFGRHYNFDISEIALRLFDPCIDLVQDRVRRHRAPSLPGPPDMQSCPGSFV